MPVGHHPLVVMNDTPPQSPAPHPFTSLLLTVALLATVLTALVAISYPGTAVVAAALAVTAASVGRVVRRRRTRKQTARRVCIPHTDVCVTV